MVGLGAALERDHRAIDLQIAKFVDGGASDGGQDALVKGMYGLRRHVYLEEEMLFPPMRAAGLMGPIMVMLREHAEMWQVLARLDGLLAAGDTDGLSGACAELVGLLEQHNVKEERILYPQADEIFDAADSGRLTDFLDSGEIPPGWVCQLAQSRAAQG